MTISIGIDLGTTNSVASLYANGRSDVIPNAEGEALTPSAVSIDRSQGKRLQLVGSSALNNAAQNPRETIVSIKRLMGHAFADKEVQDIVREKRLDYQIVAPSDGAPQDVRVVLDSKEHSPIEVSSWILVKLKRDAERALGRPVTSAVVTVPAYFSDRQRAATREAGRLAGFEIRRVLPEPTAAAIAFGLEDEDAEGQTFLVYDMGGGTFDLSVLTIADGKAQALNVDGDMWLGGDDFDRILMESVFRKLGHLDVDLSDPAWRFQLRLLCRKIKEQLSEEGCESYRAVEPAFGKNRRGRPVDVDLTVTRREFEDLIRPHVSRSIEMAHRAIAGARVPLEKIRWILLVGGTTRIPLIRAELARAFGRERIRSDVNPMEVVARGAAMLAAAIDGKECIACGHPNPKASDVCTRCGEPFDRGNTLTNVLPFAVGIELEGDLFQEIFAKSAVYPDTSRKYEFHTSCDGQKRIRVPIRQGLSSKASKNELQGVLWFDCLPPGLPENSVVNVVLTINEDGSVEGACSLPPPYRWEKSAKMDRGTHWKDGVDDVVFEAEQALGRGALRGDARIAVEKDLAALEKARDRDDPAEAQAAMKRLRERLNKKPEWQADVTGTLAMVRAFLSAMDEYLNDEAKRALKRQLEDAEGALLTGDEARARKTAEAANESMFKYRAFQMFFGEILANNSDTPAAVRGKLRDLVARAKQAFHSHRGSEFESVTDELLQQVLEAMKAGASGGGVKVSDLLRKRGG